MDRRGFETSSPHLEKEPLGMVEDVPVLPVVVPLAAVVFLLLLWDLRRRDRLSVPRAAVALALYVYAGGIVANTVFPISVGAPADSGPWKVYVESLADYEASDALMNVAVFVPLGLMLPLLMARASWWRVVVVGAVISAAIELTQLVTGRYLHGGHVADVNDLAFNVIGAALGFALFRVLLRIPGAVTLVERFRWRERVTGLRP